MLVSVIPACGTTQRGRTQALRAERPDILVLVLTAMDTPLTLRELQYGVRAALVHLQAGC